MSKDLKSFQKNIGYNFRSPNKLIQALTHSSYKNEFLHGSKKGSKLDMLDNERMEFLGDAILDFVISKKLFEIFPDESEGLLSKYRSLLVSKKSLFKIAKKIKLHYAIRLGKTESKLTLKGKTKIVADAFEAVIAAIYFDSGIKAAERFILSQFEPYLEKNKLKRLDSNENYKSLLQEALQKDYRLLPHYVTNEKAAETFEAIIYFKQKKIGSGIGTSKREAEKLAAKEALKFYRKKLKKN